MLACTRAVPLRSVRARLGRRCWHVVNHLLPPIEVSTVAGRMSVDTRDTIGRVLALAGEWEPHVTRAFRRSLARGDVCLDVGAHIGYYTLLAAKLVGPGGHVYAFEPAPSAYRALEANLARNGVANVTALNVAAGAAEGSAILHEGPLQASGLSSVSLRMLEAPGHGRAEDYTAVEVRVAAVESLVPRDLFARVRTIKVDVEGYEVEALRGIEAILAEGAPLSLIVELTPHWSAEEPAPFVEDLCARYGLAAYRLANEYSLEGYLPVRNERPVRLDAIPRERCDVLLVRGGRVGQ